MQPLPTFQATVACGLREGYDGTVHTCDEAVAIVQSYCDKVGLGVTVTPTTFVYTGGREPGVLVGLIDYPRFPSGGQAVHNHAVEIAKLLKDAFGQQRVSIIETHVTFMLGDA